MNLGTTGVSWLVWLAHRSHFQGYVRMVLNFLQRKTLSSFPFQPKFYPSFHFNRNLSRTLICLFHRHYIDGTSEPSSSHRNSITSKVIVCKFMAFLFLPLPPSCPLRVSPNVYSFVCPDLKMFSTLFWMIVFHFNSIILFNQKLFPHNSQSIAIVRWSLGAFAYNRVCRKKVDLWNHPFHYLPHQHHHHPHSRIHTYVVDCTLDSSSQ